MPIITPMITCIGVEAYIVIFVGVNRPKLQTQQAVSLLHLGADDNVTIISPRSNVVRVHHQLNIVGCSFYFCILDKRPMA